MKPRCTPFLILNQCVVHVWFQLLLLDLHTDFSGKVGWYSRILKNFPQFVVIQIVKGFSIVIKAEVVVFLVFPCFFYDTNGCWQFDLWFLFLF